MLSVNYIELIPILINAIKEQQSIIDNQDSKIVDLADSVAEIKAMLSNKSNFQEPASKKKVTVAKE